MSGRVDETLIYIRERGAARECWHPAFAEPLPGDLYRVSRTDADRPLEFTPGAIVRCEMRTFPDGSEALAAIAAADSV